MPNAYLITEQSSEAVTHALTLKAMQQTVGGLITPAFTITSPEGEHRSITGYCNDEGILLDLDPTTILHQGKHESTIHGPLLIVGLDETTGETVPLTTQELDHVRNRITLIACLGLITKEKTLRTHCLHEMKVS